MAIGERIHFFRLLRGMTQKYLGMELGFPEKSADVRLAQYEAGSRIPKAELTAALARILEVSPRALSVPDIDSYAGLMHTLFALEDNYGLKISKADGEVCLKVDAQTDEDASRLYEMLRSWQQIAAMLKAGEISKEDYDNWRYLYPEFDISGLSKSMAPYQKRIDKQSLDLEMKIANKSKGEQFIKQLLEKIEISREEEE